MTATQPRPETPPRVDADLATPLVVFDDVHVWRIPLDRSPATRRRLAALLSAEESERAGRFHAARHRDRFVVAHGALRTVLAAYLGSHAAALQFSAGSEGKPRLGCAVEATEPAELCFNLSHSADLALLAVAVGRDVGVDVERVDPRVEIEALARRFFAPEERAALARLPGEERAREFFRIWTLKEAYLKALGVGLRRALDSFAVAAGTERPPSLIRSDGDDAGRWRLRRLTVGPGFSGAVVTSLA